MAINTSNYNLKKPSSEDFYNVEDQNGNMDIIDQELKRLNEDNQNADQKISSVKSDLSTHLSDYVRQPGYAISTGVANTYLATLNPAPATFSEGLGIVLKIHAANTGPSTLNVNGIGAKPIIDSKGYEIKAGKLLYGRIYSLKYDGANFQLQGEGGEIPKLPNLIYNGNFKDTSGWGVGNAISFSTNYNLLSVTGGSTNNRVYAFNNNNANTWPYPGGVGKKIWVQVRVRVTNSVCSSLAVYVSNSANNASPNLPYINSPVESAWYTLRGIITLNFDDTYKLYIRSWYADEASANGKIMHIKDVMLFDLTEYFGAGNEPTAEEVAMTVDKTSKNIFDGELELGIINIANGVPGPDDTRMRSRNFIPVTPSTNYVASIKGVAANMAFFYYDQNKTFISYTTNSLGLFSTPANTHFLKIRTITAGDNNIYAHVQVELGSTITPFEYYLKYDWWDSDLKLLTSDANAWSSDILNNKIAYVNGSRLVGSMINRTVENNNQPALDQYANGSGRLSLRPPGGYYDGSATSWVHQDDANFIPSNIVSGKSIFGLAGTFAGKRWYRGEVSKGAGMNFLDDTGALTSASSLVVNLSLSFTPRTVIIWSNSTAGLAVMVSYEMPSTSPQGYQTIYAYGRVGNGIVVDGVYAYLNNLGFRLPVGSPPSPYTFFILE